MEHHKTLPPSSFPMLELCPYYKSGEVGEAAHRGALQHEYLECLLRAQENPNDKTKELGLSQDEIEAVDWAYDYILTAVNEAGGNRSEIKIEQKVTICDNELEEITFGHIDAAFRSIIFDYKSGQDHGYAAQMNTYALGYMQENNLPYMDAVELYGRTQTPKITRVILEDAEIRFADTLGQVMDPDKKPERNRFCKWCEKGTTCPAIINPVVTVAKAISQEDSPVEKLSRLAGLPVKEVKPEDFSFLIPAAEIIGAWCESIKAQAKVHLVKGETIPGYKLKETAGRTSISDTKKARELMNIPLDEFIACCSTSMTKLVPVWAKKTGLKKTAAKKELEAKFKDILKRGAPSKGYAVDK